MGEGYHNYHHEFQHDYRNGVKPWQFDPTKWLIWTLSKLRLVRNLRRVPANRIRSAERETGEQVPCAPAGTKRADVKLTGTRVQ
jgi:stearoyl-CoA desaturase (delta-9 desaturase)